MNIQDFREMTEIREHWQEIKQFFTYRDVAAKTTLLYEGDISQYIYFVERGALRLWNNDDGRDITMQFFFEGQHVASFESFYLNTPSRFAIECIEDSRVVMLSKADLNLLIERFPAINNYMTEFACRRLIDYMNFFLSRIKESPEQRYCELLQSNPDLLERVPHHYIASYLGITSVSLSRIRNRLKDEK